MNSPGTGRDPRSLTDRVGRLCPHFPLSAGGGDFS